MKQNLYIGSKDDSACRAIDGILDQALKKPSENSATSFFMGAADDVTLKNMIKVESVKSSAECDQQVVEAFKETKAAMQKSTGLMTQFGTDVEDAMVYTLLSNMYRKMTAPLTKNSEATYPSEFQFGNHVLCTVNNILRDGYSEKTIVDYASEVLRNDNSSYYMLEYQMELCVQYKTLVVKTVNSLLRKSPEYKPIGEGNLFSTDKELDLVSDASHAMYGCVNLLDSSIEVITSYIDKQNATRFGLKPAVKEPEEVTLEEKETEWQKKSQHDRVVEAILKLDKEGKIRQKNFYVVIQYALGELYRNKEFTDAVFTGANPKDFCDYLYRGGKISEDKVKPSNIQEHNTANIQGVVIGDDGEWQVIFGNDEYLGRITEKKKDQLNELLKLFVKYYRHGFQ